MRQDHQRPRIELDQLGAWLCCCIVFVSDFFVIPWTVAHQSLSGFPRQEYWSGLPFPSPGDLPYPGIEPTFLALARRFFTTELPGKPPP